MSDGQLAHFYRWDKQVRDEVALATVFLPLAASHIRWPVSPIISATDATVDRGGAVQCEVNPQLAQRLYRMTEHRGCYVRLDRSTLEEEQLMPVQVDVAELGRSMAWSVMHATPVDQCG